MPSWVVIKMPASTGDGGRCARDLAVQETASANTSFSTLNFTKNPPFGTHKS